MNGIILVKEPRKKAIKYSKCMINTGERNDMLTVKYSVDGEDIVLFLPKENLYKWRKVVGSRKRVWVAYAEEA